MREDGRVGIERYGIFCSEDYIRVFFLYGDRCFRRLVINMREIDRVKK